MTTTNLNKSTKVVTGKARASYVHVFQPYSNSEADPGKYSISLIIPKNDTSTYEKIKNAVNEAANIARQKYGGKLPANFKTPLNDGDQNRPDDAAYKNSWYINASCKTRPGVVDKNLNPIIDPDDFYSGCYCRASVNFYAFDKNGNRGIACGLNNLQKLAEGEPLGGRVSAEVDFSGEELIDFEPHLEMDNNSFLM